MNLAYSTRELLDNLRNKEATGVLMVNKETGHELVCNGIIPSSVGVKTVFYVIGYVSDLSNEETVMLQVYRETEARSTTCITTGYLEGLIGIADCMPITKLEGIRKYAPPKGWEWR